MSHPDYEEFINTVSEAIDALIEGLEKHYPGLGQKQYVTSEELTNFHDRMIFGVYIELIKAGYFKRDSTNENNSNY